MIVKSRKPRRPFIQAETVTNDQTLLDSLFQKTFKKNQHCAALHIIVSYESSIAKSQLLIVYMAYPNIASLEYPQCNNKRCF